jgi:glycosyltransferase involved in cell wall biosynthesis
MKVLLSAYACEPNKGSEPGVGWCWALEIARLGHDVWVLTRANNRESIEIELAKTAPVGNLHFIYYDLPEWAKRWKKGSRGVHLYCLLWQWGAYRLARKIHAQERFERVHHITFISIRQPSFMGNLGIPFIFGPVAGGERAPWPLRKGYGLRGWLRDFLRDLLSILPRVDPLIRRTFMQADQIYVTSEQTRALLPGKYRNKAVVQLAIGFSDDELAPVPEKKVVDAVAQNGLNIIYVGHLLYLKGMHLGIPAFADLLGKFPDARMTIVGSGPDEKRWRMLGERSGAGERIEWRPWVARKELSSFYSSNDVFLFPSLHDSGGMVVLEAMACGLPVICFDLGGPGVIVDDTCGFVIKTGGLNQEQAIKKMADCMIRLAEDPARVMKLALGATMRVKEFSWQAQVAKLY